MPVLALQRTAGNQAVSRVLARRRVLARKKYSEQEIAEFLRRHPPAKNETVDDYVARIKDDDLPKGDHENLPAIRKAAEALTSKGKAPAQTSTPFTFTSFAAGRGYEVDRTGEVRREYTGEGSHKPKGAVYVKEHFAIAEDKDEHAPGGVMKGFMSTAKGWVYAGTYDAEGRRVRRQKGTRGGQMGPEAIA